MTEHFVLQEASSTLRWGEAAVKLSYQQWRLIAGLVKLGGRPSRSDLILAVWGDGADSLAAPAAQLTVVMFHIRRKLRRHGLPDVFFPVFGRGIAFAPGVSVRIETAIPHVTIPGHHAPLLIRLLESHPDHARADLLLNDLTWL